MCGFYLRILDFSASVHLFMSLLAIRSSPSVNSLIVFCDHVY